MKEDFYATVKLITGEEIFAKISLITYEKVKLGFKSQVAEFFNSFKKKKETSIENTCEKIFNHFIRENETTLIVDTPVVVSEVKGRYGIAGYKLEPWIKTSIGDVMLIEMKNVLTIVETQDDVMKNLHQCFTQQVNEDIEEAKKPSSNLHSKTKKLSRKMGYISNIKEAKNLLEKIFNNS